MLILTSYITTSPAKLYFQQLPFTEPYSKPILTIHYETSIDQHVPEYFPSSPYHDMTQYD